MKPPRTDIERAKLLLCTQGWLSHCPEHFRESLMAESQWLLIAPGLPVARGGDVIGGMYGVGAGEVGLVPAFSTPDAGLIHIDRAPFWFGLQPFLTGAARQVTIVARAQCVVSHVTQQALALVLGKHPEGWRMLTIQSVAQTGIAIQALGDLLLADRHRRCGAVLLRLAGARNPGSAVHEVHCSHEELAAMCNLSRSSVASVLRLFEKDSLVEVAYRSITVRDPERLRLIVDSG